jgi:hypothetical protein
MYSNFLWRLPPISIDLLPRSTEDLESFADRCLEKTQLTMDKSVDRVQRPDNSGKAVPDALEGDASGGRVAISSVFQSEDDSERSEDIGSMMLAVRKMLDDADGDELLMEFILVRFLLRHQSGGGSTPYHSGTLLEPQP